MVEVPILQEQKSADRQGWWKCRFCKSKNLPTARDGGSADFARAKICRPPGMVEVPILQEQKSADRQGWWKCRFCRSKNLPTARDGGSADFAGAKICRPPGMVEVPILQEQKSADRQGWWKCRFCRSKNLPTAPTGGSANNVGNNYLPKPQARGVRQPRRRIMSAASPLGFSLDYRVKPDNDGITRVRHSCPGRHSNERTSPL